MIVMSSLFSMFDPVVAFGLTSVELWCIFLLLTLGPSLWLSSSWGLLVPVVMNQAVAEQDLNSTNAKPGLAGLLMYTMMFIVFINIMGLMPYSFTPSSHMCLVASVSLTLWAASIIWGLVYKPFGFITHLVPLGSPLSLAPFMVVIESISSLIRPITLSVRLMANMVSGHLIMSLLSSGLGLVSSVLGGAFVMGVLLLLEMAVAVIQGYVLVTLICLYWSEL